MRVDPLGIIERYFWVLGILVTCFNTGTWWRRAQPLLERQPERREVFRRLIFGWLLFGVIPWVVMGLGIVDGGVPTIFRYFQPGGGPWVYAWWATNILLWIFGGVWLFRGGAERLVEYRAPLRSNFDDPAKIKLFYVIGFVAGVIALTLMMLGVFTEPA